MPTPYIPTLTVFADSFTKNSDCLIIHSFYGWHEFLTDSFAGIFTLAL